MTSAVTPLWQATPAPWQWVVNPKSHTVELSRGQYGDSVMRFARWNLGGATPLFRRNGLMVRAVDLSVVEPGREHHATWWRLLRHPDAQLIEAAPELLAVVRKTVHELEALAANRAPIHPLCDEAERARQAAALASLEQLIAEHHAAIARAVPL